MKKNDSLIQEALDKEAEEMDAKMWRGQILDELSETVDQKLLGCFWEAQDSGNAKILIDLLLDFGGGDMTSGRKFRRLGELQARIDEVVKKMRNPSPLAQCRIVVTKEDDRKRMRDAYSLPYEESENET